MHGLRSALALAGSRRIGFHRTSWFAPRLPGEQEATRIEGLVGRLVSAEPNQLPAIVKELDANPEVAATYLSPLCLANATNGRREAVATACAARDGFPRPVARRTTARRTAHQQGRLRRPDSSATASLRGRAHGKTPGHPAGRESRGSSQRFRAALALADYVPESEAASWTEQDLKFVAEQLVSSNAEFQPLATRRAASDSRATAGRSGADLRRCRRRPTLSG